MAKLAEPIKFLTFFKIIDTKVPLAFDYRSKEAKWGFFMELKHVPQLRTFKSVQHMDEHVRSFLYKRKAALSEATLKVLTLIWRHSVKHPGVSFLKRATIAEKTGYSIRTIVRAVNRLIDEKLIEKVTTTKPNGKQGVNILRFLPQEEVSLPGDVTPVVTPPGTPATPENPSYTNPHQVKTTPETEDKQRKISPSNKGTIDHTFLPSFIPDHFKQIARPFLTVEEIFKAWKTVKNAFRQFKLKSPVEEYLSAVIEVFKQSVFAQKQGMIHTNLFGYFYGGLMKRFVEIVRREVMEDPNTLYYDWLNE